MDNKQIILSVLLIFFISSCDFLPFFGGEQNETSFPQTVSQWAISATASDSAGGIHGGNIDDQSPTAATGMPDVEVCDDDLKAWVINSEDDGLHYLELEYYDPVYVTKVRVKETWNPGAITKIELLNGSEFVSVWEGTYNSRECPYWFERTFRSSFRNISLDMMDFKTNKVKLTVDTDVPGWNEIDAVELIGYDTKWYEYNGTMYFE